MVHMTDDETHLSAAQFVYPITLILTGKLYLHYGKLSIHNNKTHKSLVMAHNLEIFL